MVDTLLTPTHVVRRPFSALGRTVATGELVDASEWRTVKSLIAMRYLAPIPASGTAPTECGCDRLWESPELAEQCCEIAATPPPAKTPDRRKNT